MATRRLTKKRAGAPARKPGGKAPARDKKHATRGRRTAARRAKAHDGVTPLVRVTGFGGVFFKAADPRALMGWYQKHLGIQPDAFGGWVFQWRDRRRSHRIGYTVFSPFKADTAYFDPSEKPFMFNFRVANLHALLSQLRREGIHVVDEVQELPNGRFGWIIDPDGNKIELWEPPDVDDPFSEGKV